MYVKNKREVTKYTKNMLKVSNKACKEHEVASGR